MDEFSSTHALVRHLLQIEKPEEALRVIGPVLEDNPTDIVAWHLTALSLFKLGDKKNSLKNLKSASIAFAQRGNPISALAGAILYSSLADDGDSVISKLADLYCSDSDRIEETELAPPPLPHGLKIEPWSDSLELTKAMSRAADTMAMAWGASLTLNEKDEKLPYVPLLSALDKANCEELIKSLTRKELDPDQTIITQNSIGDAMYIVAEGFVVISHQSEDGESTELAKLGPGAFFGEMALVSSAPRAAFVKTTEKTVLLCVDKTEMESLAERVPKVGDVLIAFCHARMLENLMRVSPVLAPVPAANRPELIARFGTDYKPLGEKIIEQGKEGPGLFLIVSGKVSVTKEINGENILVAELGAGDLFGEISLLMRKTSTATVVAVQNTALLVLPRDEFHKATNEFPELLKGAYDIAMEREERNNSILGQIGKNDDDLVLI